MSMKLIQSFHRDKKIKKKIATDLAHVTVMYVAQTSLAVEITACVQSENTQLDISEDTKQQRPIEICQ